jgi:hypothetical protein
MLAIRIRLGISAIRSGDSIRQFKFDLAIRNGNSNSIWRSESAIQFGNTISDVLQIRKDLPNRFAKSICLIDLAIRIRLGLSAIRFGDLIRQSDSAIRFGSSIWRSGKSVRRNTENTETRTQHHKIKEHKIKDKLNSTITSTKLRESLVIDKLAFVLNFQ